MNLLFKKFFRPFDDFWEIATEWRVFEITLGHPIFTNQALNAQFHHFKNTNA
jgi:hypothetical protein